MKTRKLVLISFIAISVLIFVGSCATTYKTRIKRNVLFQPAESGDYTEVKRLIEAGADINAQNNEGWTALMWAISPWGNIEVVKLLIEKGADVNAECWGYNPLLEVEYDFSGWTALMSASLNGKTEISKLLIEAGADVNAQNNYGETALMYASENGHIEIAKLLIENGADMKIKSIGHTKWSSFSVVSRGYTALMAASENGHTEIAELLIKEGTSERSFRIRTFLFRGSEM